MYTHQNATGDEIMDRRVKKTQTAIRKAFTELIKEKGNVDEITIKEIVDRADISRSTFYTHYSDILELTDDISNMFAEEIAELVINTHKRIDGNESYDHIYLEVLNYMLDRKELTRVMLTDMRNTALSNRIADLIMERMEDYYRSKHRIHDENLLRGTATFWTSGVLGIMRDWARYDFKYDVNQMSDIITRSIATCATIFSKENI